jgi:glycosyltransferase involved in cell wall biosynthesis
MNEAQRERQRIAYVLITPAKNEEKSINETIKSVISQTHLPNKWIIVSDGSTDRTDDIVKAYLPDYPWMDLVRMPEHGDRHFAAKVDCFYAGYERMKELPYEVIGNLDSDISFDRDYFEFLIDKFSDDPDLGVAGTPFVENGKHYDYRFTNIEHVSGACQLFRRSCFEEIGGYRPIRAGGIDWVAVTTARMKGWKTRTFVDKVCVHHRKMGTGSAGPVRTWWRQGNKDYCLGNHPLWEIVRVFYQMTKWPYGFGGILLFLGFALAMITRTRTSISTELRGFVRQEQKRRLKKILGFETSLDRHAS